MGYPFDRSGIDTGPDGVRRYRDLPQNLPVMLRSAVADYVTAYADEMEQLRAFDRSLFGGSPQERPDVYRAASPLTYVDAVRAPILVLAGENDPRCPIRQIDNYLDALAARAADYAVSRFDAGHGSLVVEQDMAHMATEVSFARQVVSE